VTDPLLPEPSDTAWEAANPLRAMQLNDMLDACPTLAEKRELFRTLTKEEQDGLMPEYTRRCADREAPVGSLVRVKYAGAGINVRGRSWSLWARYDGLATVIGQPSRGSYTRFLYLHSGVTDSGGHELWFGEANADDFEVIA
jgi:hypothetical protein